jgi:hypothetical protein
MVVFRVLTIEWSCRCRVIGTVDTARPGLNPVKSASSVVGFDPV